MHKCAELAGSLKSKHPLCATPLTPPSSTTSKLQTSISTPAPVVYRQALFSPAAAATAGVSAALRCMPPCRWSWRVSQASQATGTARRQSRQRHTASTAHQTWIFRSRGMQQTPRRQQQPATLAAGRQRASRRRGCRRRLPWPAAAGSCQTARGSWQMPGGSCWPRPRQQQRSACLPALWRLT